MWQKKITLLAVIQSASKILEEKTQSHSVKDTLLLSNPFVTHILNRNTVYVGITSRVSSCMAECLCFTLFKKQL